MTTRHGISYADELYAGNVFYYRYAPDNRRGTQLSHLFVRDYGAVAASAPAGLATSQALATTGLTMTGTMVSAGVGTLDVPRAISIGSATGGDLSVATFVIRGTDEWGEALTENIVGNTTISVGSKAFKTVTSIIPTASSALLVQVGTASTAAGTKLGLPFRIADKGKLLGIYQDGQPITGGTVVVGLATTVTVTATNGDTRGTVAPSTVPDGTIRYTVLMNIVHNDEKDVVFGITPYGA